MRKLMLLMLLVAACVTVARPSVFWTLTIDNSDVEATHVRVWCDGFNSKTIRSINLGTNAHHIRGTCRNVQIRVQYLGGRVWVSDEVPHASRMNLTVGPRPNYNFFFAGG